MAARPARLSISPPAGSAGRRDRLLSATALIGGVLLILAPEEASAACSVGINPNTVFCSTTTTTNSTNTNGAINSSSDRRQVFTNADPIMAEANGGAVSGAGLAIVSSGAGTGALTFSNFGSVSGSGLAANDGVLRLESNGLDIVYDGRANILSTAVDGLVAVQTGATGTITLDVRFRNEILAGGGPGGVDGIVAATSGTGAVNVSLLSAELEVAAATPGAGITRGIVATSSAGAAVSVVVDANSYILVGEDDFADAAIEAQTTGAGAATVTLDGTARGSLKAFASAGAATINVSNFLTSNVADDGIDPDGAGPLTASSLSAAIARSTSGAATVNVSGSTLTGAGNGVSAESATGSATVNQTGGTIVSTGASPTIAFFGIDARTTGAATGAVAATATNVTAAETGVRAAHLGAGSSGAVNVTLNAGVVSATGGNGVEATTAGSGAVAVTQNAGSTISAAGNAIVGTTTTGAASVVANGVVSSTGAGAGIVLSSASAANAVRLGAGANVSGTAGLVVSGGGRTTLSQAGRLASTAAGGSAIRIDAGSTLVLADTAGGAADGTITENIDLAAATSVFTVDRANALTFGNTAPARDGREVITGVAGSTFNKQGSGVLTLTGRNTAAESFSGTTNVSAGTLRVNGVFGDLDPAGGLNQTQVNVASGGTLGGTGTIAGSVALGSGATLAPGGTPGTLTLLGDATFAAGSTYLVEAAAGGASDRIGAGGTATLGGANVSVVTLDPEVSYQNGQSYTILQAGSVAGTFAAPTIASGSAFLRPTLTYGPTTVTLTIATAVTPPPPVTPPTTPPPAPLFVTAALTPNQRAAASGLDGLSQTPGSVSLALYNAILFSSAPDARLAFDQLSGELHASVKTGRLEEARFLRNAALDRLETTFAAIEQGSDVVDDGAVLLGATGVSAWIAGYGAWGETNGDGNAASLDRDSDGFLVGVDGLLAERLRVGVLAGYGSASFDTVGRGSANVDTTSIGVYAGTELGGLDLKAGAAYGFSEIDTARAAAFPGFSDSLSADYDGETAQVFGEAGWRFDVGPASVLTPFANLSYLSLDTDGFAERGGAAALTSDQDTTEATFTTLGLRATTMLPLGSLVLRANGMVGWRHAFGDTTPEETLRFASGPAFVVAGAPIAEDATVAEFGLDFDLSPNASLGVSYAGQYGDGKSDNGVKARFEMRF